MENKRILIADDEVAVRNLLGLVLGKEGYELMEACDGGEAVELAKESPIDLALLDVVMPVMNGIEAMKAIKEIDEKTEVVIMTGNADFTDLKRTLTENGGSDYLVKPFDNAELLRAVRGALLKRECRVLDECVDAVSKDRIARLEQQFAQKTRQLRESQISYMNMIESSNDGVDIIRGEEIVYVNRRLVEIFGYEDPKELLGKPVSILVHPDDRERVVGLVIRRQRGESVPSKHEFKGMHKDGKPLWIEASATKITYQGDIVSLAYLRDVTDRKVAEKALKQSQKRYRLISELCSDFAYAFRVEPDGTLANEWVTSAISRITGYTPKQLRSEGGWEKIIHPEDLQIPLGQLKSLLSGQSSEVEYRILTASGEERWLRDFARPVLDADQRRVEHIYGAAHDISEEKKAEAALKASVRKYRQLVQSANSIILYLDPQGRITFMNKFGLDFFGYTEEEMVGQHAIGTIVPERECEGGDLYALVGDIIRHPDRHTYNESENVRKNGECVWVAWTNRSITDSEGRPLGVLSIGMDITERRRAEKALRDSEERFKQFANSLPEVVFEIDEKGDFTFVNQNAFNVFGYTPNDFDKGLNALQMLIPEEREKVTKNIERKLRGETLGGIEYTAQRKDGSPFPIVVHSNRVIRNGNPAGLRGIIVDITERKKAEEALKKAHSEMNDLVSALSSAFIGLSPQTKIVKWNPAAKTIFNLGSSAALGKTFEECAINWDWDRVNAGICECQDTITPIRLDNVRYKRADGKNGFLNIRISPVNGNDNGFSGLIVIAMDVTEQRNIENKLLQTQKLEAIGRLAAGIAHEINTPTQYVGDNTRFLQDAFNDLIQVLEKYAELLKMVKSGNAGKDFLRDIEQRLAEADVEYLLKEVPKAIEQSLEGTDRIAKIVLAMKEFSHPGTAEKTEIDINKAIESTITVARNEWKYTAELVTDFDLSLPLVPCHVGEFNQVILNMIINAVHAINEVAGGGSAGKGTITVSTRNEGDWAEIRIRDTGSGIPEEVQPKIFDPFFTTKEMGKGTGQGLGISHSVIVEKHRGTLTFDTEVGKGTTFVIRLPVTRKR